MEKVEAEAGAGAPKGVKVPSVKLKRHFERGHYDAETRNAILDESLVGHLAVVLDGFPVVIPTTYARVGEMLYLHGSSKNRALRAAAGKPACFEVTILDGLVYAASAFNHSMNYRSVVVYATCESITDEAEKSSALSAIVDRFEDGRSAKLRPDTPDELRQTMVIKLPLDHASSKVRSGPPSDDLDGLADRTFVGVVPLRTYGGEQFAAPGSRAEAVVLPGQLRLG